MFCVWSIEQRQIIELKSLIGFMIPDKEQIRRYCKTIYAILTIKGKCTMQELHRLCSIDSTGICIALLQLIRDGKIVQTNEYGGGVIYKAIIYDEHP